MERKRIYTNITKFRKVSGVCLCAQVSIALLTCLSKACPSSLAKISSSVLPGIFRLIHSPLLQGGALAAILDFLQSLVLSKASSLGYR